SIRAQIELYKLQHNDTYPEFNKYSWKQLTYKTNNRGQISERGKELANASFGPYFLSPPTNPLTKSSEVLVVPSIPDDFKATAASSATPAAITPSSPSPPATTSPWPDSCTRPASPQFSLAIPPPTSSSATTPRSPSHSNS